MASVSLNPRFNNQTCFNYPERLTGLQNKVHELERKMGLENRVSLAVSNFNNSPAAVLSSNVVKLPAWFLFNYEDVPPRLRVRDLHDPRLNDQHFLNDAADWMQRTIRGMGLEAVSGPVNRERLQEFLELLRDPVLYEKCKDFCIGHELGHLRYSQTADKENYLSLVAGGVGGILVGLLVVFLVTALSPLVHTTITVGVTFLAVAISVGGMLTCFNKLEPGCQLTSIEEEKKADLDAVKMLNDASGGIYFFETCVRRNLLIRQLDPTSAAGIDLLGNNLNDKNHPPLSERVSYLRQWESLRHNSNRTLRFSYAQSLSS